MKRQALISALSEKAIEGQIKVISNFKNLQPKTKIAAILFKKLELSGKVLIVTAQNIQNLKLAVRNIPKIKTDIVANLNAYEVWSSQNMLLAKEAIEKFR